jgi:hypothetical protein
MGWRVANPEPSVEMDLLVRTDGTLVNMGGRCSSGWKVGKQLRIETPGAGGVRKSLGSHWNCTLGHVLSTDEMCGHD